MAHFRSQTVPQKASGLCKYQLLLRDAVRLWKVVTATVKGLEVKPHKEQLRALGLLGWRRLRSELTAVLQLSQERKRRGRL